MRQPRTIRAFLILWGVAGVVLAGCSAAHPYIHAGDANSVEVGFGGNVDTTLPLAREHCARFEKVPRFVDATTDFADYRCVRP
ncbi:MAG TPA: hypothetical protein VHW90_01615 [Stellaceae bacterium]|nr:hypothetical protein [Stellaceae bacterium]